MRPLAVLLLAATTAACGAEERDLWVDLDQVSGCYNPNARVRALDLRLVEARQSPLAFVTIEGFSECIRHDGPLLRDTLIFPFRQRGYLVKNPPSNRSLAVVVLVYELGLCPPPGQRLFPVCLTSEIFLGGAPPPRLKMHPACQSAGEPLATVWNLCGTVGAKP